MNYVALVWGCIALAGCSATEPYQRTDVWYPTGANAGNLAAMAARPRDLIVGRGASGSDGNEAASSVDRLWRGDTKPLLPSGAGASTGNAASKGSGS